MYPDPIRGGDDVLVMCEVMNPDSTPHATNTRAALADLLTDDVKAEAPLYGFEQEYTMLTPAGGVYGWPSGGYPAPQGPFYCGVGSTSVYGRPLAEAHMDACIKAGLIISGINAEVMPGQWEFQIGPVGPLEMGDQARRGWLGWWAGLARGAGVWRVRLGRARARQGAGRAASAHPRRSPRRLSAMSLTCSSA